MTRPIQAVNGRAECTDSRVLVKSPRATLELTDCGSTRTEVESRRHGNRSATVRVPGNCTVRAGVASQPPLPHSVTGPNWWSRSRTMRPAPVRSGICHARRELRLVVGLERGQGQ